MLEGAFGFWFSRNCELYSTFLYRRQLDQSQTIIQLMMGITRFVILWYRGILAIPEQISGLLVPT
jgi:hypothetical protein